MAFEHIHIKKYPDSFLEEFFSIPKLKNISLDKIKQLLDKPYLGT